MTYRILCAGLLSAAFLLAACGGGSSSGGGTTAAPADAAGGTGTPGGGGSGSGGASGGDDNAIAGTYVGPATVTATGPGFSETLTDTVQIVISNDNSVTFGDAGGSPAGTAVVGPDGRTFSLNVPASFFNEPGFDCSGTLRINGTVDGDRITGTISSSGVSCNGIPFDVSGSFDLEKTGAGTQGKTGPGLMRQLRHTLPDLVR